MIERNDPHPASESASITYVRDPEESPSRSVIRAVASVTGTDPTKLRPLYDVVDPDALDRLFDSSTRSSARADGAVSFRFNDCDVIVRADGRTVVSPAD